MVPCASTIHTYIIFRVMIVLAVNTHSQNKPENKYISNKKTYYLNINGILHTQINKSATSTRCLKQIITFGECCFVNLCHCTLSGAYYEHWDYELRLMKIRLFRFKKDNRRKDAHLFGYTEWWCHGEYSLICRYYSPSCYGGINLHVNIYA